MSGKNEKIPLTLAEKEFTLAKYEHILDMVTKFGDIVVQVQNNTKQKFVC